MLAACLAVSCLLTGCGVSHGSPEGVVKSLVKYSEKGKEKQVADCYGLKIDEADDETKAEIEAAVKFYETMKSEGVTLVKCDAIEEYKDYTYMYIYYDVNLAKKKAYPRLETYFVKKKDKDYVVVPAKEITSEMSKEAETAYAVFMTEDIYKDYQKEYDTFVLKNPRFEEELSLKLK